MDSDLAIPDLMRIDSRREGGENAPHMRRDFSVPGLEPLDMPPPPAGDGSGWCDITDEVGGVRVLSLNGRILALGDLILTFDTRR